MPKKRTSSAKTRAPYSPEEKANIIKAARELLNGGENNNSAARMLEISPNTLNRWLKEKKSVDRVRDQVKSNLNVNLHLDLSKTEMLKESMKRPKLSWEEVRDLCREYERLSAVVSKERWSLHFFESQAALDTHNELCRTQEDRLKEIESLVGMDAIHEYRDRKATRLMIEEAQEKIGNLLQQTSSLRVGVGSLSIIVLGQLLAIIAWWL